MTPALESALRRDFPALYKSGLPLAFEHGDGWERVVRQLSEILEQSLLRQLSEGRAVSAHLCEVREVRQKQGGLEFLLDGELDDEMIAAIRSAQEEALHTCERCGAFGVLRWQGSWRVVACTTHAG
jgi:hypothetical protein